MSSTSSAYLIRCERERRYGFLEYRAFKVLAANLSPVLSEKLKALGFEYDAKNQWHIHYVRPASEYLVAVRLIQQLGCAFHTDHDLESFHAGKWANMVLQDTWSTASSVPQKEDPAQEASSTTADAIEHLARPGSFDETGDAPPSESAESEPVVLTEDEDSKEDPSTTYLDYLMKFDKEEGDAMDTDDDDWGTEPEDDDVDLGEEQMEALASEVEELKADVQVVTNTPVTLE